MFSVGPPVGAQKFWENRLDENKVIEINKYVTAFSILLSFRPLVI